MSPLPRSLAEWITLTVSPITLCGVFPMLLTALYTCLLLHTSLSPVSTFGMPPPRRHTGVGGHDVSRGTQSTVGEGKASPSSKSYSAGLPDQGRPAGTAGRRGGQRGSRHRQSERSSRSGERAGPGKTGGGTGSGGRVRPCPLAGFCSHIRPNVLLLHHHLLESSFSFRSAGAFSMKPSLPESPGATAPTEGPYTTVRALHLSPPSCPHPPPGTSGRAGALDSHTGLGRGQGPD